MTGFIKDYRQELESDIWLMPPMYHRVWQWLKYQVNHRDNEIPMRDGSKLKIERGQHLTSVRNVAKGVGYYEGARWKEPNPKRISTILAWLEKQGMISINRGWGNRQYTLITLLNWDSYQVKQDEGNSKETVGKHLADINKNDKNEKKKNTSRLKYEITDMENAKLLFQLMLENNENCKEPNWNSWANEMRLMRERDKRTDEQIQYVIKWSQRDSFWKTNILSPSKLRKQFDQLIVRIKEEKEKEEKEKEAKQKGFDLSD